MSLACSKRSRTRAAPTPTNISTNSEPDSVKKGTSASPATARASSVLPVPGGPTSSTPLGMRPPRRWYLRGFLRKSTISTSSALASSTPATSAKVVFSSLRSKILCLLRPKESACVGPPPTRRMRNIQIATITASGMTQPKSRSFQKVVSMRPANSTLCARSSLMSCWSSTSGMRVVTKTRVSSSLPSSLRSRSPGALGGEGRAPGLAIPRISRSVTATFSTSSAFRSSKNFDIGISIVRGASSQLCKNDRTITATRR